MKLIHFADNNNLPAGDKLAKIRLLQDRVNASLQQFRVFAKDLAIDEQMVPYFGRHSAKIFIRGMTTLRDTDFGSLMFC